MDGDDKILEDHVLKDFVHSSYPGGRSVVITLLHDATSIISHVCEEGGVLFRICIDSDVVVPID